ncbi:MAG: type II toxin-antitoxin system VapC family toxin [Candidatus Dormibacteria bacterium]
MVWYLDTSAFLKLITTEEESPAMRRWFLAHSPIWSSQLLWTEAARAGTRLGIGREVVEAALDTVSLVLPSVRTFFEAGRLPPPGLRSLDAVHLATAIEIGDDLEGMVVYDDRLIEAARAASIPIVTPS